MIIDCISDLHGHFPKLEGGDLLIVAGDLTGRDTLQEYDMFYDWLSLQPYGFKVYIGGNHDNRLQEGKRSTPKYCDAHYLCDSGTQFEGLKIWGAPWTRKFKGQNPKCVAFALATDEDLAACWTLIPTDTDILVTHEPPYGYFDFVEGKGHVGSQSLRAALFRIKPDLHVFGHVHEGYGMDRPVLEFCGLEGYPISVNASHVNKLYKPINAPIRVIL
jgi:predicted phosphohydrolase